MGEYYQGQCLHPACPPGLVWRGKRCQKPGYLETIIEIENVLINKIHDKPYTVIENSTSHVTHHNDTSTITPITTATTTTNASPRRTLSTVKPTSPRTPRITTKRPVSTATTTKPNGSTSTSTPSLECCVVVTPRICKLYGQKWVCFNRRSRTCAARICTAPVVYLKAPEIRYRHPLLIMPPNPNLTTCRENSCDKFSTNNGSCLFIYCLFILHTRTTHFFQILLIVPDVLIAILQNVLHIVIVICARRVLVLSWI